MPAVTLPPKSYPFFDSTLKGSFREETGRTLGVALPVVPYSSLQSSSCCLTAWQRQQVHPPFLSGERSVQAAETISPPRAGLSRF